MEIHGIPHECGRILLGNIKAPTKQPWWQYQLKIGAWIGRYEQMKNQVENVGRLPDWLKDRATVYSCRSYDELRRAKFPLLCPLQASKFGCTTPSESIHFLSLNLNECYFSANSRSESYRYDPAGE
jgi:hypothetical protein